MREIKFRAWQPHASYHRQPGMYLVDDMVWHKVTDEQPNAGEVFLTSQVGTSRSSEFFEDVVIMQYTGLKDKNGVEIYEGDIVRHNQHWSDKRTQSVVEWIDSCAQFDPFGSSDWALGIKYDEVEVIGNIYENPDLLEHQK